MTSISLPSGSTIPRLGFGTYKTRDTAAAVTEALRAGYRHVDTAQMYANEAGVGAGLRASGLPREEVFVTTKLRNDRHRPEDVRPSLEGSLQELGLEQVDLFLIHWPLPTLYGGDFVSTWEAMIELAEAGLTREIGVSNFQPHHLDRLVEDTGVVPAVNQIEVHPYFTNDAVRAHCAELGTAVQAWSPLGRGDEFADPVIADVAAAHGVSPARAILRWHVQRGDVVIPKTDSPERMRDNADLFGFALSEQEMAAITGLDKGQSGRRGGHPDSFEG